MEHQRQSTTCGSESSQTLSKILPSVPEPAQDPPALQTKNSTIQSFFAYKPSDLDLQTATKLLVLPSQSQPGTTDSAKPDPSTGALKGPPRPYFNFVEMLNKKDGLVAELATPDQFEDFLSEDALSYDGVQLSKVTRFPKYYRIVADTSAAVDKGKHPKKQLLLCKFAKCRASFNKVSSLIDHLLVHEATRPYVCKQCGNSFA